MMLLRLMALVTAVVHMASAQRGTVLRQGEAGEAAQSVIVTPKTIASLSCESGDMVVKVNFTTPFKGLMYAHRSRSSPCRIHGTGAQYYELRIPLKGCGTWQESPRVFINNITIRFHPALELEEDETKTIVCRYPPPLTQTPGGIIINPPTIAPTPTTTRISTARLSEVEILIIICLLLFLSLLTLGIGIAYFCLRRRNIRVVRKVPAYSTSSAPPSQLTRLSSSALHPTSSLLSSVLGHTVRIPRAVPYSSRVGVVSAVSSPSPDHHYDDYRSASSSSSGEGSSGGEGSEATVTSSSGEDQMDASRNLLFRKGGQRSIFSIPKAILRRASPKSWWTEPTVHRPLPFRSDQASGTSVKRLEMEDQTVTTMLESENHLEDDPYYSALARIGVKRTFKTDTKESLSETPPAPLYAQVDKRKKTTTTAAAVASQRPAREPDPTGRHRFPIPGTAARDRQVVTETPEKRLTSEEVTKNTTVTTSMRREVKETRVSSAALDKYRKGLSDAFAKENMKAEAPDLPTIQEQPEESSTATPTPDIVQVHKPPKSILIRDVSDVYLTTTVETELRELTTTVSRDVVQQHAKSPSSPDDKKKLEPAVVAREAPPLNWNVVIRQKKPDTPTSGTDLDASCESNAESTDDTLEKPKPQFNVMIRSIPSPLKVQATKPEEIIDIPPLEIPQTVSKLKEALMPKTRHDGTLADARSEPIADRTGPKLSPPKGDDEVDSRHDLLPPKIVRWKADAKEHDTPDGTSTVSSTDSFQSTETLRERSSSEVLEVAPTLPSHLQALQPPTGSSLRPSMLERSSSEIVTSPDEHARWVGGVAPVLENLSPEFLANIPTAVQGGFFNRQRSPDNMKRH